MKALQNWWQRVKPTKMPAWWPASLQVDRTEPLVVTPEQYKKFIRIGVATAIFIVIAVGIGIYEFVSLQQAKDQETLHEQQLELMRDKTTSLQEKWIKWMHSTKSCGKWSRDRGLVTAQKVTVA